MLQNLAGLMKQNVLEVERIARYKEEEFVILLPMTDIGETAALAESLRILVEQHIWENPSLGKLGITISLGVAAIPSQGIDTTEHLIACTDKALQQAKANGRNRVEIYKAEI